MGKSQDPGRNRRDQSLPPMDLVNQFLKNQKKELENADQEIELRKLNEQNAYEYGCKALDAQKQDRKEQRQQTTLFMKYGFWLTIILLVLLVSFTFVCMYTNNVSIVVSGLKVMAYIIPSIVSGYFIGLNRGKKHSSINQGPTTYAEVVDDE